MRFGVLGTGVVGQTLAGKLAELGHEVKVGSRRAVGGNVTFADAAEFAEVVMNATAGVASLQALRAAGAERLAGKVLIDVANPLDFSGGTPPTLSVVNDDSLGEQIQREFPDALVVKALNTVNAGVMVEPALVPGQTNVFVCGNDPDAKAQVADLLTSFGWPAGSVIDLGGIDSSRAVEMYLPLWVRLFDVTGTPNVNIEVHS